MKFADYIKTQEAEGKEKHVPAIDIKECSSCNELIVTVQVGKEVMHPSTVEHHIKYIQLFGEKNDNKFVHISTMELGEENTLPRGKVNIKKDGFKNIIALSFCNIHGIWENNLEVKNG